MSKGLGLIIILSVKLASAQAPLFGYMAKLSNIALGICITCYLRLKLNVDVDSDYSILLQTNTNKQKETWVEMGKWALALGLDLSFLADKTHKQAQAHTDLLDLQN